MNLKKYFLLLFLVFPIQVRAVDKTFFIFTSGVLAGGAVYTVIESKKAFKETSEKQISSQVKQLWNGLQQRKLDDIKEGATGIGEKAKPYLLATYALYTGYVALGFLVSGLR